MDANNSRRAEPSLENLSATHRGYSKALGRRIARLRQERQLTQAELARIIGMSQQAVYALEFGARKLRIDLVPVLAETFGVTADELLGLKPLPPPKTTAIPERYLRHLETLRQLSEGDQRFVFKLAESMALR